MQMGTCSSTGEAGRRARVGLGRLHNDTRMMPYEAFNDEGRDDKSCND
jgi:predicted transcriptional regulator